MYGVAKNRHNSSCATVSFAELASANIVGYTTSPISGFVMATPAFSDMGKDYPIDNFTVQGATDSKTSIQVLDADGQTTGMYYWYNDGGPGYPAGWFDAAGLVSAGISLKAGESVFFYTEEAGVTIQSAGQVITTDTTNPVSGFKMLGNCTPVVLNIDDFTVQGATDSKTSIQVLDADGQTTGMYYWYNDGGPGYPAGWFDAAGLVSAGIALEPGESVFFYSEEPGVTATVPGVSL